MKYKGKIVSELCVLSTTGKGFADVSAIYDAIGGAVPNLGFEEFFYAAGRDREVKGLVEKIIENFRKNEAEEAKTDIDADGITAMAASSAAKFDSSRKSLEKFKEDMLMKEIVMMEFHRITVNSERCCLIKSLYMGFPNEVKKIVPASAFYDMVENDEEVYGWVHNHTYMALSESRPSGITSDEVEKMLSEEIARFREWDGKKKVLAEMERMRSEIYDEMYKFESDKQIGKLNHVSDVYKAFSDEVKGQVSWKEFRALLLRFQGLAFYAGFIACLSWGPYYSKKENLGHVSSAIGRRFLAEIRNDKGRKK